MLCFLSSLEGIFLGLLILTGFIAMRQWGRIDKLKAQSKGLRPADRHPQDRIGKRRTAPVAHPAPQPAAPASTPGDNVLDWLPQGFSQMSEKDYYSPEASEVASKPDPVSTVDAPESSKTPLLDTLMPHLKPFLFALSIVGVWFGLAWWYDNLNHYAPPADEIGDFRILYLKKFIGALLPLISAVGSALGLLFMLNPRYYIYLNGWFTTDYDFYADLRQLDKPECFRRVLVFAALFGLFLVVSLWVLLHSSPQELTL